MKKLAVFPLYLCCFILLVTSCKQIEKVTVRRVKTDNKKTALILKEIKQNEFHPQTLSLKASVKVNYGEDKSKSFSAKIKMAPDSLIWISITSLGYEAARVLATPDSLKLINRLDKKYYIGDYSHLQENFKVNLGFKELQALILGNSIGLDREEKIKRQHSKSKEFYYLSTINKRQYKRVTKKAKKVKREIVFSHWVRPDDYRIQKLSILDIILNNSLFVEYDNFEIFESQKLPRKVNIDIVSTEQVKLEAEYNKISVNEPLKYSFKISSRYEPIQ